jgi:RimJ/RimL family protein N-acetyltransferase
MVTVEKFLQTERLILRRFTMDDVDLLVELDSDPDVMRYVIPNVAMSRQEIIEDLLPAFLSYYERYEGYGFWAATEKDSGRFLGWFHFRPKEGKGASEPELGYRLNRSAWNRGFATEGSRALIDFGFARLSVTRVTAETMAVHGSSRRVMEKAGLRYVRTFHHDAGLGVEYALDRAQWDEEHTEPR